MLDGKPKDKPKASLADVMGKLAANHFNPTDEVFLVGIRGYYGNTFGKPGDDRIYFDDALFVIEGGTVTSFNFNSNPSVFKAGVAELVANEVYEVEKHRHHGKYPALQIVRDILKRDGETGLDSGRHGINFHYDYEYYSRFSLGCQTLPRSQWADFQTLIYRLMDRYKLNRVHYYLVNN